MTASEVVAGVVGPGQLRPDGQALCNGGERPVLVVDPRVCEAQPSVAKAHGHVVALPVRRLTGLVAEIWDAEVVDV